MANFCISCHGVLLLSLVDKKSTCVFHLIQNRHKSKSKAKKAVNYELNVIC